MYMPILKSTEENKMNIFFYIILFIMGITFGSFYTLAVYRIPKGQDITHTHSYCPNCNHKLGILDLKPVFSYIFLGAKCRYCKQKIRPRYLILETLSGILFVLFGYLMGLNVYNLQVINVIEYAFFVLYLTFIVLIAGIDKEYRQINKPVLMYGIILSIVYIVYLYIIEKTSIYRYVIYLVAITIILLIDTITLKKHAKNNYTYSVLLMIIIMSIFTGEYVTINSIIITLLAIAISLIIYKFRNGKNIKENKNYNEKISIGFYLAISNIIYLISILGYCKFLI